MKLVNVHEAKTHLSRLLDEVRDGEEVVIAKNGTPAARLVPITRSQPVMFGLLKGKLRVPDDFDAPLPDEILDLFDGKGG